MRPREHRGKKKMGGKHKGTRMAKVPMDFPGHRTYTNPTLDSGRTITLKLKKLPINPLVRKRRVKIP